MCFIKKHTKGTHKHTDKELPTMEGDSRTSMLPFAFWHLYILQVGSFSVANSCWTLLRPHELQPTRLLCPWDSPGKNTGKGCHFLLQGIILTQGWNRGLLYLLNCKKILCHEPPGKYSLRYLYNFQILHTGHSFNTRWGSSTWPPPQLILALFPARLLPCIQGLYSLGASAYSPSKCVDK